MGLAAGLVAGTVGSFTLPAVASLQALRLPRDEIVQALGLVCLTLGLAPAFGLARIALFEPPWSLLSLVAMVPALAGIDLGRRWRRRLDERRFRRVLFRARFGPGVHLVVGAGG